MEIFLKVGYMIYRVKIDYLKEDDKMELRLKFKSKLLISIITFVILIGCGMKVTYSAENVNNINEDNEENEINFEFVEYTDAYKKWLALSEEEKQNVSVPLQYDVKYTPKKFSIKDMLLGAILPDKFDWREKIQINVKDQGNTNFCWAYGATSALETHLAAKNQSFEMYSPRHMDYATSREFTDGENLHGFNRIVNDGGHCQIAMAYYTAGYGPVKETDMPFINSVVKLPLSSIEKEPQKQVKEYVYLPTVLKKREGDKITYINSMDGNGSELTEQEVINIRNTIKAHIMQNGGVSMTYNNASMSRGDDVNAYIGYTDNETFHDVAIVGWDDNYSKDNFKATPAPLHDGAYICLNSWGTESGEDGFFYISYDDMYVESRICGYVSASDIEYDQIYQHDLFIPNLGAKLTSTDTDVYTANVFKKGANKKEYVTQAGVSNRFQETTVDIYVDPTGTLDIEKAQLVKSDVKLPIGYKAVEFDPVLVEGETFAVIVKYKEKTDISVERKDEHFNLYATANNGESFCSLDGKRWIDLNRQINTANFTIKAFTVDEENPTPDTTVPQINFEPDGNFTTKVSHTTKVTVSDNVAVDESSIKYVWAQNTDKPDDSLFTNSCKNGDEVTGKCGKGAYYLWVTAKDTSGNTAYACSKAFVFDDSLPQAPSLTADARENVYTKEDVKITIVDNEGWDGLTGYQYSLDDGKTWIDYNDTSRVFDKTGVYNVIARSVGANGKCSDTTPVYVIKIDKDKPAPPILSANVSNGASSRDNVRITIKGGETPSGIKNYQYKLTRDDDWQDLGDGNTFEVTETGSYYVRVRAVNNVGTIGSSSSEYIFGIVREGIIVEFIQNGNEKYAKKAETVVKVVASGIVRKSKYLWSTKSEGITADDFGKDFKPGDTITKDTGSGEWYLWVYLTDNDANRTIERSEVFKLDNTVPNAPQVKKTENSTKTAATLEFSGSASPSGIDKYQYTFDYGQSWTGVKADADGKATLVIDKSGQYNVRVRAVNNVGIPGEVSNTISVKIESSNGNNNNNNNNNGNNGDNGNNGNNNNNNNNGNNNNGNNSGNTGNNSNNGNSGNNSNNNNSYSGNKNNNSNNSGTLTNSGSPAQNNSSNSGSGIGSTKYDGNIPNTGLDFARLVAALTVALVVTAITVIGMVIKERIDK